MNGAAKDQRQPRIPTIHPPTGPLSSALPTHLSPSYLSQSQQQQRQPVSVSMSGTEQQEQSAAVAAASAGGETGQPHSSSSSGSSNSGGGSWTIADDHSQPPPAASLSCHSTAADTAGGAMSDGGGESAPLTAASTPTTAAAAAVDSSAASATAAALSVQPSATSTTNTAMSDGNLPVAASASAAAMALGSEAAAAAAQPQSHTHADSQPHDQLTQLAIDSMTLGEAIEAMASVPSQPPDEFVDRQLRLLLRLNQLIGISNDPATWPRATSALTVEQRLIVLQVALSVEEISERADQMVRNCAAVCGLASFERSEHLPALLPTALHALQPAHSHPPQQRSAIALLSFMERRCNSEEREAIRAADFVSVAMHWLPSFHPARNRFWVLDAASDLAQPHELPPLMAMLLPHLMTEGTILGPTVHLLLRIVQTPNASLRELFDSGETAAAVAVRLVQLLVHASTHTCQNAWCVCFQMWLNVTNRQLLLNAGLLQPPHFERSMASSRASIRTNASAVLSICAQANHAARVIMIERGLLAAIMTACNDTDARVVKSGVTALHRCIIAARTEGSAHLRPAILQACTAAAFPSVTVTRLVSEGQLADFIPLLIHALSSVLTWSESEFDSARLHPRAQRIVDVGLMPHIEGHHHKPLLVLPPSAGRQSIERALRVANLVSKRIYGRCRVPPLSALMQRQFRPVPPLPIRRDSLPISRPDWFKSRVDELRQMRQQLQADIDAQAAAGAAMEEEADP